MNCCYFIGNTSCLNCGDYETRRRFYVSPVPRTNLVLIMIEYFKNKTTFQYTIKADGIPGKHKESILYLLIPCGFYVTIIDIV